MPSLIVVGHLKTSGGSARQKVIHALSKVAQYAASSEPGVLKFCIATPLHNDETSVFAIEEYADQRALDSHLASTAVSDLVKLMGSDPSLFSDAPSIYGLPSNLSPSASFTRSSLQNIPEPIVVFANIAYKPDSTTKAVGEWKQLVNNLRKSEERALSFTVVEDAGKNSIRTIEAYESAASLESFHNEPARENFQTERAVCEALRTGEEEIHKLKMVAGYLYKNSPKEKL